MSTTSEQRSKTMRAIKSRDTKPELTVRRQLHRMGYRYRLHRSDLPGKPDIVFGKRRKVIFVHGCFWHGHKCKRGSRKPLTNATYWQSKIERNVARYKEQVEELKTAGWSVLTLWECELKADGWLAEYLRQFLEDDFHNREIA